MPKCERCEKNDARVRFDAVVNGRREQHYFCRQCAEELMGEQMNALGGTAGSPFGNAGGMFGGMNGAGPMGYASNGRTATAERTADKNSKTPTLDRYGRDLTAEAAQGKLDPAAGRERGVTARVDRAGSPSEEQPRAARRAGRRQDGHRGGPRAPDQRGQRAAEFLRGKRIISLNLGGMVAGAMFRGQFEERMKSMIEEVNAKPDIILFIDELHTVVGAGLPRAPSAPPTCSSRRWRVASCACIGATTLDEYRKHIEKDAALERRFQPVLVGEPSVEEAYPCCRQCGRTTKRITACVFRMRR